MRKSGSKRYQRQCAFVYFSQERGQDRVQARKEDSRGLREWVQIQIWHQQC